MPSPAFETSAAPADLAERHFAAKLRFETDCWDVHESMASGFRFAEGGEEGSLVRAA